MRIIRFLYFRKNRMTMAFRKWWYRIHARWVASMLGGRLAWPHSATAVVPIRCDGKGTVSIGDGVGLGFRLAPRAGTGEILLQARRRDSVIRIGAGCGISNNLQIVCFQTIEIGERSLIGDFVTIFDSDFHRVDPSSRWDGSDPPQPVRIGCNVWLGSHVLVLKGVTIGDNTVVAAGSVVNKSLPPNVIAAGVPARIVRQL